jgi:hypothetical protein
MKTSNLALRLEAFAALEQDTQYAERLLPRVFVMAGRAGTGSAKRRLTLGAYRIQIRDSGMRPFRVF